MKTLSEKIQDKGCYNIVSHKYCFEKDVKEFIVKIKATMLLTPSPTERGKFIQWLAREIDKLAGGELVK